MFWRTLITIFAVAAGYFLLARVSLFLSFESSNATPLWPPSGYAFAVLLLLGYRITPAIFLGAFTVNAVVFQINEAASLATSLWVSSLIGLGNAGEAVSGVYLLRRLLPDVTDNNYFRKPGHIFRFLLVAATMSVVSSLVGTSAIFFGEIITPDQYATAWLTWWLGDVSGVLLVTPLILTWRNSFFSRSPNPELAPKLRMESIALFVLIVFATGIVFNAWNFSFFVFRWAFWILPFLVWAALRFGQWETVTAIFLCSLVAVLGTLNGGGPFSPRDGTPTALNDSLLILQSFVCIVVITTMTLNASVNEQKRSEAALRTIGDELEQRVASRTEQLRDTSYKLEVLNSQFAEAQRLAHIGNWDWDIVTNRISWSDEIYRIFGVTPQVFEASYEAFLGYIHPDEREQIHAIIRDALMTHQPYSFYHRIVRPDGQVRILHGRGRVLVNEKNEPVKMAGTAQDVTEIKQAEQEIKQLADDLMRYNNQLEQKNRELESFSFVASHDLQEPLRKIRTFLGLIAEREADGLSDVSRDYLRRILLSAERMQQLINDLLAYSRTTGSPEHFQRTDLNQVLEKVMSELGDVIAEKNAQIERGLLPELKVIPFQFEQLFTNILSNSLKFSRPQVPPHIVITAAAPESVEGLPETVAAKRYYSLRFADNGIGFDRQYTEKIFDLFQRLHKGSDYEGTGIGLSICKKIVENHGGFITASGEPGRGATFTIYIPDGE